jgi:hypothetical protein
MRLWISEIRGWWPSPNCADGEAARCVGAGAKGQIPRAVGGGFSLSSAEIAPVSRLWETVDMPKKKTVRRKAAKKAIGDKQNAKAARRMAAQRRGSVEELEDSIRMRHEATKDEGFSRPAARIVWQATEQE